MAQLPHMSQPVRYQRNHRYHRLIVRAIPHKATTRIPRNLTHIQVLPHKAMLATNQ